MTQDDHIKTTETIAAELTAIGQRTDGTDLVMVACLHDYSNNITNIVASVPIPVKIASIFLQAIISGALKDPCDCPECSRHVAALREIKAILKDVSTISNDKLLH